MMQLTCPKCQTINDVAFAQPQIMNFVTVSMIVIEHGGALTCPGCLTKMVAQVAGMAGLSLGLAEVAPPAERKLIVMPGAGTTPH